MTTRQIGTSTDLGINSHPGTLHEEITHNLGEYAGEHDIDAIEADYRSAIAAVLPRGVWLSGETLYSDRDDDLELGFIRNTLESIPASEDFWSIVEERAHVQACAENVADALRAELDEANAALARSRATHDEAEAAWGRAKQKPQVWWAGDHEPPMTTPSLPLLDKHGRRWSSWYTNCWCCHNEHGKQLPPHPGLLRWRDLLNDFGPLTEVIR